MIPFRFLPQPTDFLTLGVDEDVGVDDDDSCTMVCDEDDLGGSATVEDDAGCTLIEEDCGRISCEEDSGNASIEEDDSTKAGAISLDEICSISPDEVGMMSILLEMPLTGLVFSGTCESELSAISELMGLSGCEMLSSQFQRPRTITMPRMQSDLECGFMVCLLFCQKCLFCSNLE